MFYSLFHLFSHSRMQCAVTQSFYSRSAFRAAHDVSLNAPPLSSPLDRPEARLGTTSSLATLATCLASQSSPVPSSRARVTYTTHRSHTHVTLLHLVSEVRFTNLDNRQSQSQSQSRSHVVVNLTHGNGNHHVAATSAVNRPITRRIVVITDAGQFHRREAGT